MQEKKIGTEGMETENLEMSQRMEDRIDCIDKALYWYLMQLLDLKVEEAEKVIPWNSEIIRKILDSTISILKEYGHAVCNPYISEPKYGRRYFCTLSECGCERCNCQDEFMEKERILSYIEEAAAAAGLEIVGGSQDGVIVREGSTDKDFKIHVMPE